VWLNGKELGERPYGYSSFAFDLTPYIVNMQVVSPIGDSDAVSPNGDFMACRQSATLLICRQSLTSWEKEGDMRIRTPADLGLIIREHRLKLGLDQKSLAQNVGVSRQWIVDAEKGRPRAEIGLLLRTVNALGIAIDAEAEGQPKPKQATSSSKPEPQVDLDSIIEAARKKRT
jgi:HTH-type transcriptional regulator / antitoxin HipB